MSYARVIRITSTPDGVAQIRYKDTVRRAGWFPRPCPPGNMDYANEIFQSGDPCAGAIRHFSCDALTDHGQRQQYRYRVHHYGRGESTDFVLSCPSIGLVKNAQTTPLFFAGAWVTIHDINRFDSSICL
jgi:hypothetical protein